MNNEKKTEKGQAIVYLVIGLVVFLGFVALAIDGGMALADRRHAQNIADAASLAGGAAAGLHLEKLSNLTCKVPWTCANSIVSDSRAIAVGQAIDSAHSNAFTIDDNISDHNGVNTSCGPNGSDSTKFIDVTVEVSSTTPSNFMQLIFPKALHNEVEAVTRVDPGGPIGNNDAIIGLNPGACVGGNGVTVNGSGKTIVDGGNIFSNGCIQGNGSKGSAKVIEPGTISGHYAQPGNIVFTPTIQITGTILDISEYHIDPPVCTTWYDGNHLPNGDLSGLYCINNNLDLKPGMTGHAVTFYVPNGTVSANGNENNPIVMYAPSRDPADPGYVASTNGIYGILFFVPNGGAVTINGASKDRFHGLIYAPKSSVSMTGNADNIFWGQVIGWDVKIGGTNDMQVNYDLCLGYMNPPTLKLYK